MSNKIVKQTENDSAVQKKKAAPKQLQSRSVFNPVPIFIGIGVLAVIVICILVGYDQMHRKLILTVNDEKIYLDEMGYNIYEAEASIPFYDSMYQQFYGANYLDYEEEDGYTNREKMSQEILNQTTQMEVLCQEAAKANFAMTDEDKTEARTKADEVMKNITVKQKLKEGLSEKAILALLEKQVFADRYKASIIAGLGIDYDGIKKGISKKDYKQYDIQYYQIDTVTENEAGESVPVSAEEKTQALTKMQTLLTTINASDKFEDLVNAEDEKETITFNGEGSFIEKDGIFDEEVDKKIKKMQNGTVSEILEGKSGYYIVKMINNNSTESYEQEIETQTTKAEEEAFSGEYEKMLENYTIKVNDKEWDKITIGRFSE